MKLIFVSIAIVALTSAGGAQSPQSRPRTLILDLTGDKVIRTTGPIATEGGGVGTPAQSLPFEVRLRSLTRHDLRLGDRLAFEVEVTNTGNAIFEFPRSSDLAQFVPGGRNAIARIYLRVSRENQLPVNFAAFTLAGSDEVPGTLQPLEPGQRLLIRLQGSVALSGETIDDLSTRGATPVNAVVDIDGPDVSVKWTAAVSTNSLPIILRR